MMIPEHDIAPPHPSTGPVAVEPPGWRWRHKFSAALLIVLCLELGLFLLVFPWTGYWQNNYFATAVHWRRFWLNPYFRGAISGLGVANLYLSLTELFRFRRFLRRQ